MNFSKLITVNEYTIVARIVQSYCLLYEKRKKKYMAEIDNLAELHERSDVFTSGGTGISQPEGSAIKADKIHAKYKDVLAIEKAINNVVSAEDNEIYGGKLAQAILYNLKGEVTCNYLIMNNYIFDSRNTFYSKRKKFVLSVAVDLGIMGL